MGPLRNSGQLLYSIFSVRLDGAKSCMQLCTATTFSQGFTTGSTSEVEECLIIIASFPPHVANSRIGLIGHSLLMLSPPRLPTKKRRFWVEIIRAVQHAQLHFHAKTLLCQFTVSTYVEGENKKLQFWECFMFLRLLPSWPLT